MYLHKYIIDQLFIPCERIQICNLGQYTELHKIYYLTQWFPTFTLHFPLFDGQWSFPPGPLLHGTSFGAKKLPYIST